jgi:hypothetical protein
MRMLVVLSERMRSTLQAYAVRCALSTTSIRVSVCVSVCEREREREMLRTQCYAVLQAYA